MELTPDSTIFAVIAIGFLYGLTHAVEADHLAAVATIVSEKKSVWASAIIGGLWGLGHTISLLTVGILVIYAKVQISESVEAKLEAIVGLMLILLGINALRKVLSSEKIHLHQHTHKGHTHGHPHMHANETAETSHHGFSPRSVFVGMVHGLAGSAALMLLVLSSISSPSIAVLYIVVFGIGSIGGMLIMSLLMSLPLTFTLNRSELLNKGIRVCAGLFSLVWGSLLAYEKLLHN